MVRIVNGFDSFKTCKWFLRKIHISRNIFNLKKEKSIAKLRNLIDFLNSVGANIHLNVDHSIVMKPSHIQINQKEFTIIADYIEAGTYFAIGAGADDSELTIK